MTSASVTLTALILTFLSLLSVMVFVAVMSRMNRRQTAELLTFSREILGQVSGMAGQAATEVRALSRETNLTISKLVSPPPQPSSPESQAPEAVLSPRMAWEDVTMPAEMRELQEMNGNGVAPPAGWIRPDLRQMMEAEVEADAPPDLGPAWTAMPPANR